MAEETRIHMFEFRGRAEIVRRAQGQGPPPDESRIVNHINDNSFVIARAIQDELGRGLSPSVSAQVQIHFHEGSIGFAGIAVVVDTLASFGGASDLGTVFSRLLEFVIQRVVHSWIRAEIDPAIFTTSVQVDVGQSSPTPRSEWTNLRNLVGLMIANLILLLVLILLLLRLLPIQQPPPGGYTPTPISTLPFTFTPLPTLTRTPTETPTPTLTPVPTVTPFSSPTPSPTLTPFP